MYTRREVRPTGPPERPHSTERNLEPRRSRRVRQQRQHTRQQFQNSKEETALPHIRKFKIDLKSLFEIFFLNLKGEMTKHQSVHCLNLFT